MSLRRATILALGFIACTGSAPDAREGRTQSAARSASDSVSKASLIALDSVHFENEMAEGFLYRFAVSLNGSEDTIAGVLCSERPVLVDDSVVTGIAYDTTGEMSTGFRYIISSRRLDTVAVPRDLNPTVTHIAFAPDGNHVAYVRFPGDYTGRGIVREWPNGLVVVETPVVMVAATDVLTGTARWLDANQFEIFITPEAQNTRGSNGPTWVRFRGTVSGPPVRQDTVAALP